VTTLVTLSNIAAKQTTSTEVTEKLVTQLMDYLHTHKDATILYVASDIVLSVHSDASYLSEPKACSRLGGIFLMGALPKHNTQIQLNRPILASTAKAKLGALFYNCQDSMILHLTFDNLML
jgi:hypothetical protein